jgi:hypothetical protein
VLIQMYWEDSSIVQIDSGKEGQFCAVAHEVGEMGSSTFFFELFDVVIT